MQNLANLGNPCKKNLNKFYVSFGYLGFSKSYVTLQMNDWKPGKQIVANFGNPCENVLNLFFYVFFWLQNFQKGITHNNWMTGSQENRSYYKNLTNLPRIKS